MGTSVAMVHAEGIVFPFRGYFKKIVRQLPLFFFFFLNDPPPPETSPLPLHAALPISPPRRFGATDRDRRDPRRHRGARRPLVGRASSACAGRGTRRAAAPLRRRWAPGPPFRAPPCWPGRPPCASPRRRQGRGC